MSMKKNAWYRLLQVVTVIAYLLVVGISLLFLSSALDSRELLSATVICADGTKKDAFPDILGYSPCAGSRVSELTDKKYAWNWNLITWPLITLLVGWSLVDSVKIALIYVISGKKRVDESWVLRMMSFLFQSEEKTKEELEQEKKELVDHYLKPFVVLGIILLLAVVAMFLIDWFR